MHPIERLRYVARSGDTDPVLVAVEAAEALASLGRDTQALVPSCRRLLESHPTCGPLWWTAARMIVAEDPRRAAYEAICALEQDQCAEELASSFPAASSLVIPARRGVVEAVELRPDVSVCVVGSPYRLQQLLGRMTGPHDVIGVDQADLEAGYDELPAADLVVLEALCAGPSGVLVDHDQAGLLDRAERSGIESWVLVGVGRLLPEALFLEVVRRVASSGEGRNEDSGEPSFGLEDPYEPSRPFRASLHRDEAEVIAATRFSAVVGVRGRTVPALGLAHPGCVAPAELIGFRGLG